MKNVSLKAKLVGLCTFLSAVPITVGYVAYTGQEKVAQKYEKVTELVVPNIESAQAMFLNFRRERIVLRDMIIYYGNAERFKVSKAGLEENNQEFEKNRKDYLSTPFINDEEKNLFEKADKDWLAFKEVGLKIVSLVEAKAPLNEIVALLDKEDVHGKKYRQDIIDLVAFHSKNGETWTTEAKEIRASSAKLILSIIAIGVLSGLIIGLLFASRISKLIASISKDLANGADQVSMAADQISQTAQNLSQSSTQQASSLEETVATMEEMTSMVKLNSDNGKQAAALAVGAREMASRGDDQVAQLIRSIEQISNDSRKIEEITGVIDDIAFQINLLALNAAVEAARAGDQGKGFAVVADAVRTLAQRSATAAKEIDDLIKGSVERIGIGRNQAAESGKILAEIVTSIKKVSDLNQEIASASQEQSNGIEQISKAMNQMDQGTQQNAAASEEAAAAAEELSAQSETLRSGVSVLEVAVLGDNAKTPELNPSSVPSVKTPMKAAKPSNVIPLKKNLVSKSPGKAASQEVIPFEDDESESARASFAKASDF